MREAILKAADHIERTPGCLNWSNGAVPPRHMPLSESTIPCCPLAWIGYFTERSVSGCHEMVAIDLRSSSSLFYQELDSFVKGYISWKWWYTLAEDRLFFRISPWATDRQICADCLRKYADKFFPAKHEGIPERVKEIFQVGEIAYEPV